MAHNGQYMPLDRRRNHIIDYIKKTWLILLLGTILYIVGIGVLFTNERLTAQKIVSLDEALEKVTTVRDDGTSLRSYDDGQLLHISGMLKTDEPLTEPDYNIIVQAVKLKRRVQMYQWVEEESEQNYGESEDIIDTASKTYYYTRQWRDRLIDSSLFYIRYGHENPKVFPVNNRIQIASHVAVDDFELGEKAKNAINDFVEITADARPDDSAIKLHSGMYYHCIDVFSPEIGDIRLQFLTAGIESKSYTVIGKYENGLIEPYTTSINTSVLIVLPGKHAVNDAFYAAHYERKLHAWGLRFIGWVLLFFATTCCSQLFAVAVGDIHFFSYFLPNPRQPLYGNILLSLSTAFSITALSWLVFRPWLGLGMLLAAISPFILCTRGIVHSYQPVSG